MPCGLPLGESGSIFIPSPGLELGDWLTGPEPLNIGGEIVALGGMMLKVEEGIVGCWRTIGGGELGKELGEATWY